MFLIYIIFSLILLHVINFTLKKNNILVYKSFGFSHKEKKRDKIFSLFFVQKQAKKTLF